MEQEEKICASKEVLGSISRGLIEDRTGSVYPTSPHSSHLPPSFPFPSLQSLFIFWWYWLSSIELCPWPLSFVCMCAHVCEVGGEKDQERPRENERQTEAGWGSRLAWDSVHRPWPCHLPASVSWVAGMMCLCHHPWLRAVLCLCSFCGLEMEPRALHSEASEPGTTQLHLSPLSL